MSSLVTYEMYEAYIPLGFFTLYLTQNVRETQGSAGYSSTVTVGRNHIGQFPDEYKYIVKIFKKYVQRFQSFGPMNLKLKYEDVFLHLHQNRTRYDEIAHSSCYISMSYVLQYHKNLDDLNSYLARCVAANHVMTRRYPRHWMDYYILVGIQEYYAEYLRLDNEQQERNDASIFVVYSTIGFKLDNYNYHRVQSRIGGASHNSDYYGTLNEFKGV